MPKFAKYSKNDTHSYVLGPFPALELLRYRPQQAMALLLHPEADRNEGALKLKEAFDRRGLYTEVAPKALARIGAPENCYAAAVFKKYTCALSSEESHVVLHNISDMGNLGTILRTCLGLGIANVALISPSADVFDPRVIRASMGAVFGMNICYYETFDTYADAFPQHEKYYFRLQNAQPLYMQKPSGLCSLVFGNEGAGLPDDLLLREHGVTISQSDAIDSLNLSVAAGIGISYFSHALGWIKEAEK